MTDSKWEFWLVAVLVGFFVGVAVGRVEFLQQPAAPKIEEPEKTTTHLHFHMESCGKKGRFGI